MPRNNYIEKLKDQRWQKKRLEVFKRDNWQCQLCGTFEGSFHTHHRRYFPSIENPWDYPMEFLVTLCEECHQDETEFMKQACHSLINNLKEKFFAMDIFYLADAIKGFKIHPATEIKHIYNTYNTHSNYMPEESLFKPHNAPKTNMEMLVQAIHSPNSEKIQIELFKYLLVLK